MPVTYSGLLATCVPTRPEGQRKSLTIRRGEGGACPAHHPYTNTPTTPTPTLYIVRLVLVLVIALLQYLPLCSSMSFPTPGRLRHLFSIQDSEDSDLE